MEGYVFLDSPYPLVAGDVIYSLQVIASKHGANVKSTRLEGDYLNGEYLLELDCEFTPLDGSDYIDTESIVRDVAKVDHMKSFTFVVHDDCELDTVYLLEEGIIQVCKMDAILEQ